MKSELYSIELLFMMGSCFILQYVRRLNRSIRLKKIHDVSIKEWTNDVSPPIAKIQGKSVIIGAVEGENRGNSPMSPPKMIYDPYYWIRDDKRENTEVIALLKAENEYFESQVRDHKNLQKVIYNEFLSHIQETDQSVPYPYDDYMYYSRTQQGYSYRIYCRKHKQSDTEEILLDMNEIAKGKEHCDLGTLSPSPDHSILAYTLDEAGNERYTTYFKDLKTSRMIDTEKLPENDGAIEWGSDNSCVFYSTLDEVNRPFKLWCHKMYSSTKDDELLLHEKDERFWINFCKTTSNQFLLCNCSTSQSTEVSFLDLVHDTKKKLRILHPRQNNLRYYVDHWGDFFYIITNANNCKNQTLVKTPISHTALSNWIQIFPYDENLTMQKLTCFSKKILISGRKKGFSCIWIFDPITEQLEKLDDFPENIATLNVGINMNFDSDVVRVLYNSLTRPCTTYDISFKNNEKKIIHIKKVPNYNKEMYVSQRLYAPSHDNKMVPMSMVYKRDSVFDLDRKDLSDKKRIPGPILLDGYGSYGICNEPEFNSNYISLLDRGIAIIHAHVRGGSEMGITWYEDEGKFLTKKNTFLDFVACARYLTDNGYTNNNMLAIHGRSAGGLLIGNVLNMAPHLFKCAIMGVPFVDLINTMSDPSIPLTCIEYDEWGNPNEEKYFSYMQSYCPYSNLTAQPYPSIMVLAGLHDPRVAYWEPAKYVQRMRERSTSGPDKTIILKTDLTSGHFSASDRYQYLHEKSIEYAYLIHQLIK